MRAARTGLQDADEEITREPYGPQHLHMPGFGYRIRGGLDLADLEKEMRKRCLERRDTAMQRMGGDWQLRDRGFGFDRERTK